MALTTRFTELVGCMVPIQCAGMALASPKLAIEVARAGGLGMLSGVMLSKEQIEARLTEIPENMKQMPWLHGVVEGPESGDRLEAWFSYEFQVVISKRDTGEVECQDFGKQIKQIYDPDANTVTVSHTMDDFHEKMGESILDFPKKITKLFEDAGERVVWHPGKYRGKDVRICRMRAFLGGMDTMVEMYVETERNIVLFVNQKVFDKTGKQLAMEVNATFDYPKKGPDTIFDVGVPASARIVQVEREEEEKTAFDTAFQEAIEKVDHAENWPDPRDLVIAYWQARAAKNYDEMAMFWPGSATWHHQVAEKEDPVEYVFGEVQLAEIKGHIAVPYASKSYYDKQGRYSLNMILRHEKSATGRYYIVSGN